MKNTSRCELLAKPLTYEGTNKTLRAHSEAVKRTALTILDNTNIFQCLKDNLKDVNASLREYIEISAILHDIGKSDVRFQNRMYGINYSSDVYHPLLSLPILQNVLEDRFKDSYLTDICLLSVASHHTPLWESLYLEHQNHKIQLQDWIEDNIEYLMIDWGFKPNSYKNHIKKPYIILEKSKRKLLTIINKNIQDNDGDPLFYRYLYGFISGIINRADHLVSSEAWLSRLNKPSEIISKHKITKYQAKAGNIKGNLFITLPTGLGKTETALNWFNNQQNSRLFYVLPTRSTINSMYNRLNSLFFDKTGLLHSSYKFFLHNEKNEEDFYQYKNLQKDVTVITPDQLILTLMNKSNFGEKELVYSNSCFIFDEIHTYSPKTFFLIKYMLKYFNLEYSVPICIMSATFPNFLKKQFGFLSAKELLHDKEINSIYNNLDRVKPVYENSNIVDNLDMIIGDYEAGKNVLLVLNTVDQSRIVYNILEEIEVINHKDIELLHSRFINKHRKEKTDRIKEFEQKNGKIFVSTQIVEVSLDISFDVLYTEVCPIDSLSQRFGRINRRIDFSNLSNKKTATAYIFEPKTDLPYSNLNKAREVIIWLSENYENEYSLLNSNNRFYEKIKKDILQKDEDYYENIWKELSYIYSPRLYDNEFQKLIKTRSGFMSISGVPISFENELKKIKKEKKGRSIKEKSILNIKKQQYLTSIPIYKARKVIDLDLSSRYNINVFNVEYNKEIGVTYGGNNII